MRVLVEKAPTVGVRCLVPENMNHSVDKMSHVGGWEVCSCGEPVSTARLGHAMQPVGWGRRTYQWVTDGHKANSV